MRYAIATRSSDGSFIHIMDPSVYQELDDYVEAKKTWTPEPVMIEVVRSENVKFSQTSTSDSTDEPVEEVDLISLIKGSDPQRGKGRALFLPPKFNENTQNFRKVVLLPYFREVCLTGGFSVRSKGWEKELGAVRFMCSRGRAVEPKSGRKQRDTVTIRPTKEEGTCKFGFRVNWDESNKRWFMYELGLGCSEHTGHVPRPKDAICQSIRQVDEQEQQIVLDAGKLLVGADTIQGLLRERTGVTLTTKQIRTFTQSRLTKSKEDGPSLTAADRLVQDLTNNPRVSYIILTAEVELGKSLSNSKRRSMKLKTLRGKGGTPNEPEVTTEDKLYSDSAESPRQFVETIADSSTLSGEGKVLLAVAWIDDESRRYMAMFGEAMSTDVTMKTNKEKRPLIMDVGKTSENQTFTGLRAFLPSQSRWAYDWYFNIASPALYHPHTLKRNRRRTTDAEEKEYGPLVTSIGKVFPESSHGLCVWHLINRGLKENVRTGRLAGNAKKNAYYDAFSRWLYSFSEYIESPEECQVSSALLCHWLKSSDVQEVLGVSLANECLAFFTKSFEPHMDKIVYFRRMNIRSLGLRTSSHSEVENSSMKRYGLGPRPQHTLDKSVRAMLGHAEKRTGEKARKAADAMDSQPMDKIGSGSDLYKKLTDYAAQALEENYASSDEYLLFRQDKSTFYVKARSYPDFSDTFLKFIVARFEHTRVVSIHQAASGQYYVVCSCGLHAQFGFGCPHVYKVLDREPLSTDAAARWLLSYILLYMEGDNEFDTKMDRAIDNEPNGLYVNPSDLDLKWEVGHGDGDREYFLESLGKVKLQRGTFWSNHNESLPIEVSQSLIERQVRVPVAHPAAMQQTVMLSQQAEREFGEQDDLLPSDFGAGDDMEDRTEGEEEAAAAAPAEEDEEEVQDGGVSIAGSTGTRIGIGRGGEDIASSQNSRSLDEEIRGLARIKGSTYNLFHDRYQRVSELASTGEGRLIVRDGLDRMAAQLVELLRTTGDKSDREMTLDDGFVSMPEPERGRSSKRYKKASSPTKKGRNQN